MCTVCSFILALFSWWLKLSMHTGHFPCLEQLHIVHAHTNPTQGYPHSTSNHITEEAPIHMWPWYRLPANFHTTMPGSPCPSPPLPFPSAPCHVAWLTSETFQNQVEKPIHNVQVYRKQCQSFDIIIILNLKKVQKHLVVRKILQKRRKGNSVTIPPKKFWKTSRLVPGPCYIGAGHIFLNWYDGVGR